MAETKTAKHQAHGLDTDQMKELHYKQQQGGEDIETVTKANGYALPKHEAHLVHAKLQVGGFNPTTGEATAQPFVQKYGKQEFEQMKKNNAFQGMKVEVLHDGSELSASAPAKAKGTQEGGEGSEGASDKPQDLTKLKVEELKEKLLSLYDEADKETVEIPAKKADIIAAIEEREAFLAEEAKGK